MIYWLIAICGIEGKCTMPRKRGSARRAAAGHSRQRYARAVGRRHLRRRPFDGKPANCRFAARDAGDSGAKYHGSSRRQ